MATEEAKAAAEKMHDSLLEALSHYFSNGSRSQEEKDSISEGYKERVARIIDADFGEVIKERDDLKAALGELMKAIEAYDLDLTDPRDYEERLCNLADAEFAAKKLLDPKTVVDK